MQFVCFACWVGYGIYRARQVPYLRQKLSRIPLSKRGILGALLMFLGVLVLFGSLAGLQAVGLAPEGKPQPGAWPIILLAGLAFVHAQTLGMALVVSLAHDTVTSKRRETSVPTSEEIAPTEDNKSPESK